MSEDRDTEQVSSTWLAQLRREYVIYGSECARLQKDLDSTKRMFENAVMTIVTIGEATGVRGEDQQNGHIEIVEAINKIKGRRAVYKAKATELERELEVWRSGPVCWSCGDSGQVHSLDGEWRGECNCQGAVDARRIAELTAELAESRKCAEIMQQGAFAYQAELAAIKAQEPIGWYTEDHLDDKSATTYSWTVAERWVGKGWPVSPLYAAPVPEAKAQGVTDEQAAFEAAVAAVNERGWSTSTDLARQIWNAARLNAAPVQHAQLLDRSAIREVFMRNGFTIKEGQSDLKPYVYAAADELLRLAAPVQQVSVPDGWKLVPVDPTPEMISAGSDAAHAGGCDLYQLTREVMNAYPAMLAAAPAAPAADAGVNSHD